MLGQNALLLSGRCGTDCQRTVKDSGQEAARVSLPAMFRLAFVEQGQVSANLAFLYAAHNALFGKRNLVRPPN